MTPRHVSFDSATDTFVLPSVPDNLPDLTSVMFRLHERMKELYLDHVLLEIEAALKDCPVLEGFTVTWSVTEEGSNHAEFSIDEYEFDAADEDDEEEVEASENAKAAFRDLRERLEDYPSWAWLLSEFNSAFRNVAWTTETVATTGKKLFGSQWESRMARQNLIALDAEVPDPSSDTPRPRHRM